MNTLFDIPAVACMLILVFSMFDKKRLLVMTAALYVLELLYHFLILHTIGPFTSDQTFIRLGLGATVIAGSIAIARYRINRRQEVRKRYDLTLAQLETSGRQNAEFLSNVSHELRTPINMVLGLSDVILEKIFLRISGQICSPYSWQANAFPTRSTTCWTIQRLWKAH